MRVHSIVPFLSVVLLALSTSAFGQFHSKLEIAAAERTHSFAFVDAPDDQHVVLVLTLGGFSDFQWNRLGLSNFAVTAAGQTYRAQARTVRDLNPAAGDEARDITMASIYGGPGRVAFIVPVSVREFEFRFRDDAPVAFAASDSIQKRIW
jgi:hypothetical protein